MCNVALGHVIPRKIVGSLFNHEDFWIATEMGRADESNWSFEQVAFCAKRDIDALGGHSFYLHAFRVSTDGASILEETESSFIVPWDQDCYRSLLWPIWRMASRKSSLSWSFALETKLDRGIMYALIHQTLLVGNSNDDSTPDFLIQRSEEVTLAFDRTSHKWRQAVASIRPERSRNLSAPCKSWSSSGLLQVKVLHRQTATSLQKPLDKPDIYKWKMWPASQSMKTLQFSSSFSSGLDFV